MANDIQPVTGYKTGKKSIDKVFKKRQMSSCLDSKRAFRKKQVK